MNAKTLPRIFQSVTRSINKFSRETNKQILSDSSWV